MLNNHNNGSKIKKLNVSQTSTDKLEGWGGIMTDFLNNVTIAKMSWIFHYDSGTKKTGCCEDKEPISLMEKARMSPQSKKYSNKMYFAS